ncbi:hypothetical protein EV421DRAFT_1741871 [Armillaria borealis]|uniref:Uncharacterized protein n=1 Tax=Armillaria borealis TaxID=47425 RepID=A0AA39IYT6_9AGAR|nr:hypothetical protein EV421DRAFT_1741871 [Armillaria borealis]
MSLSDHRAYEKFNIRCLKYHKQSSKWQELLDKYNAENREPDPLWPMIWVLEYRAIGVEPDIHLESSEQFAEDLNPETLAKAREGAGTLDLDLELDGLPTPLLCMVAFSRDSYQST